MFGKSEVVYSVDRHQVRKAEVIANLVLEKIPGSKLVIEDDGLTLGIQLNKGAIVWVCRLLKDERDGAHGWQRAAESRVEEIVYGVRNIKMKEVS